LKSKQVGNNIGPEMEKVGNNFDPGLGNNIDPKLRKPGNNFGPRQIILTVTRKSQLVSMTFNIICLSSLSLYLF